MARRARGAPPGRRGANRLRIIGGQWRGRRLAFPPVAGLRPTPDRVRETLFNWLAPVVEGARCLDLFGGSGALGLEAVSRGAARVVMVERDPRLVRALREHCSTLGAVGITVHEQDVRRFLTAAPEPFDIVFLDPPFGSGLVGPVAGLLAAHGWLAADARVYVESQAGVDTDPLPADWIVLREGAAGAVRYRLASPAQGDGWSGSGACSTIDEPASRRRP